MPQAILEPGFSWRPYNNEKINVKQRGPRCETRRRRADLFGLEPGRYPPSGGGREGGENIINFLSAPVREEAQKGQAEDRGPSILLAAFSTGTMKT